MSAYSDLLKDPRWQKRRLEILQRDKFTCQRCGDDKSTLHVHHGYYAKGMRPWDYDSDTLLTVCENCHGDVEEERQRLMYMCGRITRFNMFTASDEAVFEIWRRLHGDGNGK